jgi:hypothetical protein
MATNDSDIEMGLQSSDKADSSSDEVLSSLQYPDNDSFLDAGDSTSDELPTVSMARPTVNLKEMTEWTSNSKPKTKVESSLHIALKDKNAPLLQYFKQCMQAEYDEQVARETEKLEMEREREIGWFVRGMSKKRFFRDVSRYGCMYSAYGKEDKRMRSCRAFGVLVV